MEKVAFELYDHMSKISNVRLIHYSGTNKFFPVFLPLFLFRAAWNLFTKKIDVIYLQDGLLSPLGVVLKISGKPVTITIHGLDVTYKNTLYQYLIPKCIKRLEKIICISNATSEECIERGIPSEKIVIIPNGVSDEYYITQDRAILKERLSKKINISLKDKKIILSVGRLVERKGFHWFIENVIPKLIEKNGEFIYLIAGEGKMRAKIQNIILQNKLDNKVIILGMVEDEALKLLYNIADVFVMPNIPVTGDMEGFGMVILEGVSCGLPVVASDLEGIRDAIKHGENGFLVKPYDIDDFSNIIIRLFMNDIERERFGAAARIFNKEKFDWRSITEKYIATLRIVHESQL